MYSQEAAQNFQQREQRAKEREAMSARLKEQERLQAEQRRARRDQEAANARAGAPYQQSDDYTTRPRVRARQPLTTQESHDRTQMSRKAYEQARATRDVLSANRSNRTSNREIIDGRGSIDSRAFNEHNELVGYSIDGRDKPRPAVDATNPKTKWHSHAGQGFASDTESVGTAGKGLFRRKSDLGSLSDTISGKDNYTSNSGIFSDVPDSIKYLAALVVVLVIILLIVVFVL